MYLCRFNEDEGGTIHKIITTKEGIVRVLDTRETACRMPIARRSITIFKGKEEKINCKECLKLM